MEIGSIERADEFDFQGRQAIVIHALGCNLKCAYCRYASRFGDCSSTAVHDWDYALNYISKRMHRLDGVVFSGGEPTLQEDLQDCMAQVKVMGLAVKLDTNGTQPDVLRELIANGLVDFISMDVKAPLENYATMVGRRFDVECIRTSIWIIKQSGVPHEFRTTVVPGLHTTRELKRIAELVHGADCYTVQDFISDNPLRKEFQGRPAFPHKPLEDIRRYVEKRVKKYEIRHSAMAKVMPVARRRRRTTPVAT